MRPGLSTLKPYQPGRAIDEVRRELGIATLAKLASNENPLGPSPRALVAARRAAAQTNRYPEGDAHNLRKALSKKWALAGGQFVFGNGSNEILVLAAQAYCRPGEKVVFSDKSFVVYEMAAIQAGARPVAVASPDFEHDLDAIARKSRGARLVYICNPNNPTGSFHDPDSIERCLRKIPSKALVVLDEAYAEYSGQTYARDKRWLKKFPNLLICRTFSKAYGLAGFRIGYGVAATEIVDALERCRQPFNTSLVAQAAAEAALSDGAFVRKSVALNQKSMKLVTAYFKKKNIWFKPSRTNFVFFKSPAGQADWNDYFLRNGLILRPMGSGYLRVTLGTEKENRKFLKVLDKGLKNG